MLSNKKLDPIVTELFIRGRKLTISIVFIAKSYFAVQGNIRLHTILLWKFQTNESFHKSHFIIHQTLNMKTLVNLNKKCTAKSFLFLVIVTILALDNPLLFRKDLLERI